jgi:cobyrinic acid a,c-diamide synthase
MNSIIIAAPQSSSGKTTITLGLMACMQRRGLVVAPFKVGPDFIDPGWHQIVTGRPSLNLDGWICPEEFILETLVRHAQDADIAVIEGVMGLFDGVDGVSDAGSTAQVAKIVNAPVILVVDAKSQARSVAALVKGFADFDPQLYIAGVIFNNVGSEKHGRILRDAVESSTTGIRIFGCILRDEALRIPSRHLGLITAGESPLPGNYLEQLADLIGKQIDLEAILSLRGHPLTLDTDGQSQGMTPSVKIAVARDLAFCFVYEDNLRLLREAGAELIVFSPLDDKALPEGIGGLYLPGGYPELYAEPLAANQRMKVEIREAIESGMPVYAECGGLIYLTRGIRGESLTPFVGIFPVATQMLTRRKALGYREVELLADTPVGANGYIARGHEFHYSEMEEMPEKIERAYQVSKNGLDLGLEGYRYKNCLASYIHLHFGSCPKMAVTFVENCRNYINR